jgi:sugar (pentulose or hexulose) kinase
VYSSRAESGDWRAASLISTDSAAAQRAGVGAAIIAGIGSGVFKGYEDVRKLDPVFKAVTQPNPEVAARYEFHYQRFADVYPRLRDWF